MRVTPLTVSSFRPERAPCLSVLTCFSFTEIAQYAIEGAALPLSIVLRAELNARSIGISFQGS